MSERLYVNVYLVDRAYGGPEEGGWWFDYGQPIESRLYDTELGADVMHEILTEHYNRINNGRRPIDSILSDGVYRVCREHHFAQTWPETRPHYE